MYRYWTGSAWTPYVSANPNSGAPISTETPYVAAAQPKKARVGWMIGAVAVLVAVCLVGYFLASALSGGGIPFIPDEGGVEPTTATVDCPKASNDEQSETAASVNGRLYGGKLSYEELAAPWSEPYTDDRLAFADSGVEQVVLDQSGYDGEHSWVSSVLVAEVYSGDGFGGVKAGAELILECAKGAFYSNTHVTQETLSSQAYNVDGHNGWLIEATINFNIENLNATYDYVLFLLVETGDNTYSVFYASIPNTSSALIPDAEYALQTLRVDS
jgi:hypothetical protein